MQRFLRKIPLAGAAVLAVASMSCGDSTTLPSRAAQRHAVTGGAPTLDINSDALVSGVQSTKFTLTSAGGTFQVGNVYTLNFPANSVCDPAVSSYGPGTWDDACTTLADGQSITVTATYGFSNSGLFVDFSPALRFNPNTKVTIATSIYALSLTQYADYFASNPSALHFLGIYYTPDRGTTSVTDAGHDGSLITHVNLKAGVVWRRIKHFSGYNVFTGLPCDPSPDDPDCVDDGGPSLDGGTGGDGG